jgi:hypothetical protein
MRDLSRIQVTPGTEPGVLEIVSSPDNPGLILHILSGEAFQKLTGVGNHVSVSATPSPTSDAAPTPPPSDSPPPSPGIDAGLPLS